MSWALRRALGCDTSARPPTSVPPRRRGSVRTGFSGSCSCPAERLESKRSSAKAARRGLVGRGSLIDGSSYPIYLGHGSDLVGEDWWFGTPFIVGGPAWTKDANGYLHTPDGLYVVCPKDGGCFGAHSDAFQVITADLAINCEEA